MPKCEMSEHMLACVDRCSVNTDYGKALYNYEAVEIVHLFFTSVFFFILEVTDETQRRFQVPVSTWTIPVCEEDWDQGQLLI